MGCGIFLILIGFIGVGTMLSVQADLWGIFLSLVFVVLGILLIAHNSQMKATKEMVNDKKRKEKALEKWISETLQEWQMTPEEVKPLHSADKFYILKSEWKKFLFFRHQTSYLQKEKAVKDDFEHVLIDLNHVKKIALKTDETVIGEATKENGVARALVGGALFGAAGAIVGSATAIEKIEQSKKLSRIQLEIISDDPHQPYSSIELYNSQIPLDPLDPIPTKKEYDAQELEKIELSIQNLYWALESLLDKKDDPIKMEPTNKATEPTFTQSVSDELRKLHTLLQEGILTDEEYETQKKRLLG